MYIDLESANGSYLKARENFIDKLAPESAPNKRLAASTCYMTEKEIIEFIQNRKKPSFFNPNSLRTPVSLNAPLGTPSTFTDWIYYKNTLKQIGVDVRGSSSYLSSEPIGRGNCFVLYGVKT